MKNQFNVESDYLVGLIEANGSIYVPSRERSIKTDKIIYPSLIISCHSNNLKLMENIKNYYNIGNTYKVKNENTSRLNISNNELKSIIPYLNGKFKTPKLNKFNELIEYFNKRDKLNNPKYPRNNSNINENSWLTGFAEGDSCFYLDITKKNSVSCDFSITQRVIDISGGTCKEFLTEITKYLDVNLNYSSGYYRIKASSEKSRKILIDYLTKYPLKGSKNLDYLDWLKVHKMKEEAKIKGTNLDLETIISIKNGMNSKRSF